MNVVWIGTGAIGAPMALRLKAAGHDVIALTRRSADLAMPSDTLDSLPRRVKEADTVFTCLPSPDDVRSVWLGRNGVLAHLRPGSIVVDTSTIGPGPARELHQQAAERDLLALDAPVSGGPAKAATGDLSVMVGGEVDAFSRAAPLLSELGTPVHCGGPGEGQAVKLVNQVILAGMMTGIASGFALAREGGLDLDQLGQVLGSGALRGHLFEAIWPRMSARQLEGGFAVAHMRKDLRLAASEAAERGVEIDIITLADQLFGRAEAAWGPGCGTHSIGWVAAG